MSSVDDMTSSTTVRGQQRVRTPARLMLVFPPALAGSILLSEGRITLGRRPNEKGDFLDDPTVSRAHITVEWRGADNVYVLSDLESRNGTWVRGKCLSKGESIQLEHGDLIRLGDTLAVFESGRSLALDGSSVDCEALPGESSAIRTLRHQIERAASDPSPTLLLGSRGTGKEITGLEIHRLSRRSGPWVMMNCAALTPLLAESQLFGQVDQPGLLERANGGTLFLSEVGELGQKVQKKLLRAIQEREVIAAGTMVAVPVDVRLVAASKPSLLNAVESGEFRRDLYARLSLWQIHVPDLVDRRADILPWLERLHHRWCVDRPGACHAVLRYDINVAVRLLSDQWIDNLRGLDRLVHHLAVVATEGLVTEEELDGYVATLLPVEDRLSQQV